MMPNMLGSRLFLILILLHSFALQAMERDELKARFTSHLEAEDMWGLLQLHQAASLADVRIRTPYANIETFNDLRFRLPDYGRWVYYRRGEWYMVGNDALRFFDSSGYPTRPLIKTAARGEQSWVSRNGSFFLSSVHWHNSRSDTYYTVSAIQDLDNNETVIKTKSIETPRELELERRGMLSEDGLTAAISYRNPEDRSQDQIYIFGKDIGPRWHPEYRNPRAVGNKAQWLIAQHTRNGWHFLAEKKDPEKIRLLAAGPSCAIILKDKQAIINLPDGQS